MIGIDSRTGSKELMQYLPATIAVLGNYDADAEFAGKDGVYGIERKTVGEMVASATGATRFTGEQLPRMLEVYHVSVLVVEGIYKRDAQGNLCVFSKGSFTSNIKPKPITFDHYMNHLNTLRFETPLLVLHSNTIAETAALILSLYHHRNSEHSSHIAVHCGSISLLNRPTRLQKWLAQLPGVGIDLSRRVEKQFNIPRQIANMGDGYWQKVDGIGVKKAATIVKWLETGKE